jgi:hemolysin III
MVKLKTPPYKETLREEIFNSITHGIGFVFAIVALICLLFVSNEHPNGMALFASAIYGTSVIILYLISTLYHGIQHTKTKYVFKILDHCAIYVLIAGSYTPFALLALQGTFGWAVFAIVWSIAVLGIIFKAFYTNSFEKTSTILYLLMGWGGVLMIKPLYQLLSIEVFSLLVAGGITYTLGIIFFVWERLHYSHAIWHIFVFIGSLLHFLAILFYLLK